MSESRNSILKKEKIAEKEENVINEPPKEEDANENIENSNPILRISENITEFIGTDTKKYNLRKNDLISLPPDMSEMLLKRGVAKQIKR